MRASLEKPLPEWRTVLTGGLGLAAFIMAFVTDNGALGASALAASVLLILFMWLGPEVPDMLEGNVESGPGGFRVGWKRKQETKEVEASTDAASDDAVAELEDSIASDDPGPPSPSSQDARVIGALNYAAGDISLRSILASASSSSLSGCDLRVYLLDEDEDVLRTVVPSGSHAAWEPGHGAVGEAYRDGQLVVASGDAASDATHGLTRRQQRRYEKLTAVMAAPIFNARGTVIGVVSAASEAFDHQLDTTDAEECLTFLALLVSRVLVELLQWFDDDE